ncbi:RTA1-domain-containing protein [Cylindrobasidium torrendii FP15055 ss-10]|uniref:RTA1-domain-containing protein n=1 Tax=Cylindrobasidium torrendii FP15055 ss-10 TaxID=1314674 RepID=A0A0D7B200_9AGAR|nr:RTA1-domain-containing protein [Cylindrobasidium torrendii FP15055 ss-10]
MDNDNASHETGYSSYLGYAPSVPLAAIGTVLYLIVFLAQAWLVWKRGARWMMAMPIAVKFYMMGIGLRFAIRIFPETLGVFVVANLFITLSPCGMIAAEYVLLGRLSRYLRCDDFLLVSARKITLVFVLSDVITFLVQAGGGGIMVMEDKHELGEKIFLVGLILQLVSFVIFTLIFARMILLIHSRRPEVWNKDSHESRMNNWTTLAAGMCASCIGIIVRSIYRVVEISGGWGSKLSTTEGYFWALDALPLLIAVAIYVPLWPGRFIPAETSFTGVEMKTTSNDSQQSA